MKTFIISSLFALSSLAAPIEDNAFLVREAEPQLGASVGATVGGVSTGLRVAAAVPGSSDGSPSYYVPIIQQHNNHRANHSAIDIIWDTGLAATAQTIASSCIYGHNTTVNGGGYGQNIGAGYTPAQAPAMLTNGMYNGEIGYYPYPQPGFEPDLTLFAKWGHFSQIVWKSTTKVGCFTQYCPNGLGNVGNANVRPYFTVCNYSPPGNYYKQFGANVGTPLGSATVVVPM